MVSLGLDLLSRTVIGSGSKDGIGEVSSNTMQPMVRKLNTLTLSTKPAPSPAKVKGTPDRSTQLVPKLRQLSKEGGRGAHASLLSLFQGRGIRESS